MAKGKGVFTFMKQMRLDLAKRKLEGELTRLINLMEGHKAVSLPAGHLYYRMLEARAQKAIVDYQDYATKLGFPVADYNDIALGAPMLRELEQMSSGTTGDSAVPKVVGAAVVGTFIVGTAGTLILAVWHNMFLWATHYANIHWGIHNL